MSTTSQRYLQAPVLEPGGDRHPIITVSAGRALAVLRIAFGLTFLWAFVDKLFGFGYATKSGKGWIDGGDPTAGFLGKGTNGPFADFYQGLVGDPAVHGRPGRDRAGVDVGDRDADRGGFRRGAVSVDVVGEPAAGEQPG